MTSQQSAPTRGFWVVGALFLVWNLLGLLAFVMQVTMSEATLAALPEAQRQLYSNIPVWVTGAFGVAVIAGTLGCLCLLLRKSWAVPLLIASLVGVLIQNFYMFGMSDVLEVMGPTSFVMPMMVIVGGVFLIWYARRAKDRGWIH